jgi:hypothetical protein
MKASVSILPAAILACSLLVAHADPREELTGAIKKLSGESGYAWTTTPKTEGSESARRQGPLDGKTEKDGYTLVKGTAGENSYEVAFKGEKLVVNYNGDWLSSAEIGEGSRIVERLRALKRPAEEAEQLVKKAGELKQEPAGIYSGEMSPEFAKELFALLGRRAAESTDAKGSIKFWLKDGQLTKYEFAVRGTITAGEEKKKVDISRTMTVEIKNVGSTKVSLPEDAKKKLS